MYTKEDIEKAKQYLDNEGYGTGSNFTLNAVANLMAEYAAKNCVIPDVSVSLPDAEIITWLRKQNYQTEMGEQEYRMYFDVDMPKIIRAAIAQFSSGNER